MKNKLQIILILFLIYLCTYIFYGKNSIGKEIIKNTTFKKVKDSLQIQLFDLDDYIKNQSEIIAILKGKGFEKVRVNFAENFLDDEKYSYWLDLEQLTPFVIFSYDGHFKKNYISEEFESIYIWSFFKWIRIYKSKNRAIY